MSKEWVAADGRPLEGMWSWHSSLNFTSGPCLCYGEQRASKPFSASLSLVGHVLGFDLSCLLRDGLFWSCVLV